MKVSKSELNHAASAAYLGNMLLDTTYSKLHYHCSDVVELTSQKIESECSPSVSIGVLLKGRLEFWLDNHYFDLDTSKTGEPLCFAYSLLRPTRWCRQLIKNNHVRKAVLTLPQQWLTQISEKSYDIDQLMTALHLSHANLFSSKASVRQIKLVEQLIQNSNRTTSLLEVESISLQIVIEGLKQLKPSINAFNSKKLLAIDTSKESIQIKAFIDSWIDTQDPMQLLSLTMMANKLGASVSTMQRQFQRSFNKSIMEYIRSRKLSIAYDNLVKGLNIGEVAYLSGYIHTSNFTTAFKRQFGKTPKQVVSEKSKS